MAEALAAAPSAGCELRFWRHPRPDGAAGRCIGRTDLALDPRRAKRLAHRIVAAARRDGLPREVWTSPLARCRAVGTALARRGWAHRIDARLAELDFGAWDGLRWCDIAPSAVAAWEADFARHRPGGGESLAALAARAHGFVAERRAAGARHVLIVGHAGWLNALRLDDAALAQAGRWPAAPGYGAPLRWGSVPADGPGAAADFGS